MICVSRAPEEEDRGTFAGVQDSQEVCTTSFSTSPPSQVEYTAILFKASLHVIELLLNFRPLSPFLSLYLFFFYCLYLCYLSVCVHWAHHPQNSLSPPPWIVFSFHWLLDLSLTLWVSAGLWQRKPTFITRGFHLFWRAWGHLSCSFNISWSVKEKSSYWCEVILLLCKRGSNNTEPERHFQKL